MIASAIALFIAALLAAVFGLLGVASFAALAAWILYGVGLASVILAIARDESA